MALIIQLVFALFIFTKIINHTDDTSDNIGITTTPGVTIIIAAFNEYHNLMQLLPLLRNQDYPNFEILIADDRSEDGTYDYLLTNPDHIKNLSFVRIMDLPQHFTAKKYALTMAIKKAKNDILLFTDADCRPASNQWLKNMLTQMSTDKEIVLGFSPYLKQNNKVNALIRYETFQTVLQYFSFALAKIPYMGVGRNLMYKKSLFWKNNGFASHHGLLSGDDDLFVNETGNKENVAICTNPDSYISSIPKQTWSEWFYQKKRHMSVGKKYNFKSRFTLGLLWISQLLSWFMLVPAFFANPDWFYAPDWSRIPNEFFKEYKLPHFYLYSDWMRLITLVFIVWLLIKWIVLAKVNNKLGKTIENIKIPFYEFLYTCYLFFIGIITVFSNPMKIKWK